ncbi:MAG: hypothetical protein GX465_17010 [Acidobacteria bacterium]|nr:hypothetical protein [Acidobacteriota bacterium]
MSYIRSPSVLHHFYSISDLYVYNSGDNMEDCHATYDHNPSLIELIGTIIARETNDPKYARKIIEILAYKLGCLDKLRPVSLTYDEWEKERKEFCKLHNHGEKAIICYYITKNMHWNEESEEDVINYIANIHLTGELI